MEKGVDDVERALERAVGATEEGHDAYLENVDLWFVPRQLVGRNRARFPGLFSYFALAHSGGEVAGRTVHFVEADANGWDVYVHDRGPRTAMAKRFLGPVR